MENLAISPSPLVVKSFIEQHLKIYAIPMHVSMFDLGYKEQNQLLDLASRFRRMFSKDIEVKFTDTVYTINSKLTK